MPRPEMQAGICTDTAAADTADQTVHMQIAAHNFTPARALQDNRMWLYLQNIVGNILLAGRVADTCTKCSAEQSNALHASLM